MWVPYQLSVKNKIHHVTITICSAHLSRLGRDPSIQQIVIGNEKWMILYNNPHNKKQWLTPGQPILPTSKSGLHGLHPKKVLLSVW